VRNKPPIAFGLAGFLVITLSIGLIPWVNTFLKLHEMRVPYIVTSGLLTLVGLICFAHFELLSSVLRQAFYGGLTGQIASFVAIIFANFFVKNGAERTFQSFRRFGAWDMLSLDFLVAALLGGWLMGIIVFLVWGWLRSKFT
jgi:hypothetical protein